MYVQEINNENLEEQNMEDEDEHMEDVKDDDELSSSDDCSCPSDAMAETTTGGNSSKQLTNNTDSSKRMKASCRERRRRHVLNDALKCLRQKVPCANQRSNKLSKIEVLRLAIDYIAMLSCYLNYTSPSAGSYSSSYTDTTGNNVGAGNIVTHAQSSYGGGYYTQPPNPYERWSSQSYPYPMRPLQEEQQYNYQEVRNDPRMDTRMAQDYYYNHANGYRI